MLKINSIAKSIPLPVRKYKGRPKKGQEITPNFDANFKGIKILRSRGFNYSQIHNVLVNKAGIKCTFPTFFLWAKAHGI
jgi:hypothetical protein